MTVKASCHCGATRFEIPEVPAQVTRCTCTFCSKRGVLWAYYEPAQFTLTTPRSALATYSRAERALNKHHFCPTCGCGTFSETPSWVDHRPDPSKPRIGVNARLLDGVDVEAIPITVVDGKNLW